MKKYIFYVIGILSIVILIPIGLNYFVFGNNAFSNVSNDGWASFFGSYIGSVIGALSALLVVKLELNHDKKVRQEEENDKIRPYLYLKVVKRTTDGNVTKVEGELYNVGLQAACDIYMYDNDADKIGQNKIIWSEHMIIPQNGFQTVSFELNLNDSVFYKFVFYDIKSNRYEQEIRAVYTMAEKKKMLNSFLSLEPKMDKMHN